MPFILLELLTALSRVLVRVGTLPRHGNYLIIYKQWLEITRRALAVKLWAQSFVVAAKYIVMNDKKSPCWNAMGSILAIISTNVVCCRCCLLLTC